MAIVHFPHPQVLFTNLVIGGGGGGGGGGGDKERTLVINIDLPRPIICCIVLVQKPSYYWLVKRLMAASDWLLNFCTLGCCLVIDCLQYCTRLDNSGQDKLITVFPCFVLILKYHKIPRFIIIMFYAWRLVKWKLILNTNKFCVDSEKTSVKVVFC